MQFRLGCALWAYKEWAGSFFPATARSPDYLRLYGERLTMVEGNTTFYSLPSVETVARWAKDTPAAFRFCPKFPKWVTHQGLLSPRLAQALEFWERMQGLGDRLGPLFVQLPPSYGPDALADLQAFLAALPLSAGQVAVEVRHPEWFQPAAAIALSACLTELGVGRVLLDTRPVYDVPDDPQIWSERKKPRLPVVFEQTAAFSLVRYISHPQWELNLPFLADWVEPIATWLQADTAVYFCVHCPVEVRSPGNADAIYHYLTAQGLELPPLPWHAIAPEPVQLTLL